VKSFKERNPIALGVIGSVALAALLTVTLNYDNLPVVGGGTTYEAEFSEAAGLQPDDEVRIAGIKVGEVRTVRLADDHVLVSFRVKNAWIGDRTSAEIKIKTLLGRKFLALNPTGEDVQSPDQPIPRTRTVTPYDVTEAFNGLANTAGSIDTRQLADSFTAISDTFRNAPAHVDPSCQSNPRAREAARTVSPAASADRATRLPVRPEAPVTTTVMFRAFCVMPTSQLPPAARDHR